MDGSFTVPRSKEEETKGSYMYNDIDHVKSNARIK